MPEKLQSRKFWVALGAALAVLLKEGFGIEVSAEAIIFLSVTMGSYLLGQSWVDGQKEKNKSND